MDDDKCLRCGQCCFMPEGQGSPTTEPCRYLVFNEDGTSQCRIYEQRIGTCLKGKIVCGFRSDDRFDYENCPYNTGGKPVFSVNRKRVRRILWETD